MARYSNYRTSRDVCFNEYFSKYKIRGGWMEFFKQGDYNLFVTLAFNKEMLPEYAYHYLDEFNSRINRKVMGKMWHTLSEEERVSFIAIPEHPDTNYHYHLVVKVPNDRQKIFHDNCECIWRRLFISGTTNVQDIFNAETLALYMTKEFTGDFIYSGDFRKN